MAVADDIGTRQWRRITATVKPLRGTRGEPSEPPSPPRHAELVSASIELKHRAAPGTLKPVQGDEARVRQGGGTANPPPSLPPSLQNLDRNWERNLRSGKLSIDMVIDLHDHHLSGAHIALARALDRAVLQGARMLLVVAGKARGSDEAPRGAIRRELATWLSHSPHAPRILAVRNAHPRHGGAGAVYVVLRNVRSGV